MYFCRLSDFVHEAEEWREGEDFLWRCEPGRCVAPRQREHHKQPRWLAGMSWRQGKSPSYRIFLFIYFYRKKNSLEQISTFIKVNLKVPPLFFKILILGCKSTHQVFDRVCFFCFFICLFLRLTCGGTLNPNIRTAWRLRVFIISLKLNRGVSYMDTYGYLSYSCHASVQPTAIRCMIIKIKLCFLLLHSWSSKWSGLVEKTLTSQSMTFTF